MALPLTPIALTVLRYAPAAGAAVATAVYAYSRRRSVDQRAEDLMDDLPDGIEVTKTHEGDQMNATGRIRRTIRLANGKGVEIEAAGFARIRLKKVG